ncbi:hypothetical protein [Sodalis sp. dw_96]|uniref:hypothetical protein n=1 Tax=Sodalis sp. dw_96 TaxID=2719794 RepID=UPI001BD4D216|nr:hypothetical protein [Sodalis sp. dw_96]
MNLQLWTAVITGIGQIIAILIYRHNTIKDKDQIDIDLIKELRERTPSTYLTENLFIKRYGCPHVTIDDIKILISHPKPRQAIRKYVSANKRIDIFHLQLINKKLIGVYSPSFSTVKKRAFTATANIMSSLFFYIASLYLIIKSLKSILLIKNLIITDNIIEYTPLIAGVLLLTILFIFFTFACALASLSTIFSETNLSGIIKDYDKNKDNIQNDDFLERWIRN